MLYKCWNVPDIIENYIMVVFFLPLHIAFERVCNYLFFEISPGPLLGLAHVDLGKPPAAQLVTFICQLFRFDSFAAASTSLQDIAMVCSTSKCVSLCLK